MAGFEFATANRIIVGEGCATSAPELAAGYGRHVLVVAGRDPGRAEWMVEALQARDVDVVLLCVQGEPDLPFVAGGAELARRRTTDAVVGLGGGSALDAAKAIAALATSPGEPLDYLEVVGGGQPLTAVPLPVIAIPTTAGTGSEVTRNAVLTVPGRRAKASLRSPLMLPRVAIVDPLLTYDLPPSITAATGLDALTQLIEPFMSARANPLTDAVCRDGIVRVARSLCRACDDGHHAEARSDMSLASLFGGIALANAGLGAVHGLAAPIGAMFNAPHGAVCAALLPHVMGANVRALRAGAPESAGLARAAEVGRMLTGHPGAGADDGIAWVRETVARLRIPSLSDAGVTTADLPAIVEHAQRASSMKSNPVALAPEELTEVLQAAL